MKKIKLSGRQMNLIKEEIVADGNSEHNPYAKKWERQKNILKDYIINDGVLMQSMENGKIYKVLYDNDLSSNLGIEFCYCIEYNQTTLKPSGTIYIRALNTFTYNIKNVEYDTRGRDNMEGTDDDIM